MSRRGSCGIGSSSVSDTTDSTSISASYRTRGRSRTMAVMQLGNETTTVYAEGSGFVSARIFDAPREMVWKVLTEAEHIPNWWGPRDRPMTVVDMDVRVGGTWRWVTSSSDGQEVPFKGEYLEVVPPERLVNTEI